MTNNNNDNDSFEKMVLPSSLAWIASTFEYYTIPSDIGKDIVDPLDDHIQHRCQSHYLGPAYIKSSNHPAIQVDFYKVTRSEISEMVYDMKKSKRRSSFGGTDVYVDGCTGTALSSPEGTDNCHYLSETTHTSQGEQLNLSDTLITGGITLPLILPPKKRKKRRVTQQCVIFSFKNPHDPHGPLSPGDTYYLFPKNSVMTTINDIITLQMHCTSKRSSILWNDSTIKYRTKLEELAAICSSTELIGPHDLSVNPSFSDTEYDSIHIEISDASVDLYYSLKEIVAGCNVTGQEKGNLAQTHKQHLTTLKNDHVFYSNRALFVDETVVQGPRTTTANGSTMTAELYSSDTNQHNRSTLQDCNKRKHMTISTSDKDHPPIPKKKKKTKRTSMINHGKQDLNATIKIRRCAYCRVTSTPMWRRGPEGAGTLCNACGVKWKHGKILTDDDNSSNQKHLGKTTSKQKKSTTWTCKKEKRSKTIESGTRHTTALIMDDSGSTAPVDLQLHEHIYYARQTINPIQYDTNIPIHARSSGDLIASPSPSSVSNESVDHSPFTSFSSSPTSIDDSQQHPLSFITEKFGLDDDDLALTSAAADVEAAAVLTLLSQS